METEKLHRTGAADRVPTITGLHVRLGESESGKEI